MAEKLKMHIWSTTPAIADNTKQLQDKVNELIDEIDALKRALAEPSNDNGALPIPDVSLSVCPKCGCELFYAKRSKKWMCSLETCDWQTGR